MAYFSPSELLRVLLVRPDVRETIAAVMQEFEDTTGRKTYVPVDGGFRTLDDQARIYERSKREGFRAAPPGQSDHEWGAAVDLVIVGIPQNAEADQRNPLYKTLADIAVRRGLRAGFYFVSGKPDPYHFDTNEPLDVMRAKFDALKKKILSLPSSSSSSSSSSSRR